MDISPRFIVVDDDKFNNALCKMVISKICGDDVEVLTFHDPISGFEHIIRHYQSYTPQHPVILLLDINMPIMDGWEFLSKFNQILQSRNETIFRRLLIYVLSSSVDKKDIDKALLFENVTDYIIKPITKDSVVGIIELLKQLNSASG